MDPVWGFELVRFKQAWRDLTGRRDIVGEKDKRKVTETLSIMHKTIRKMAITKDELEFCHADTYGKFLADVSKEFDMIKRINGYNSNDSFKFDMLLGWCNKSKRIEKFVVKLLAEYENGIKLFTVSKKPQQYRKNVDIFFMDKVYHFLLEDHFGIYYVGPSGAYNVLVIPNGEDEPMEARDFMKMKRPLAHGVNVTYILRRLLSVERPSLYQRRFVRRFSRRDLTSGLLPGQDKSRPSENSGKV